VRLPFKLYWIETPSSEENCFVAARSKRAAGRYEDEGTGFDPGDGKAELVMSLDHNWVKDFYQQLYQAKDEPLDSVQAFYVQSEDVVQLGVKWTVVEGDDLFQYGDREFLRQGDLNYIASLGDDPKKIVIRSVTDLLEIIERDAPGDWLFRGHSSWRWPLEASVYRLRKDTKLSPQQMIAFERKLLGEFKRRARMFLPNPPTSDWEWMILAQHFGLATRLLDWTENPLVALYFAVRENNGDDDGMLYAYRHSAAEIEIESNTDPFTIKKMK
jgi:FRG domain